ncbi:hypothetical protein D187_001724 [Cystobacter fuscus DSM 2262]|uniref:Uncharacterized protein n=1 Tax=Cystobacter fuscus (strain ATCC 25194 / DSM 2262 / NBRC 100088 / M29) TaxID=1242864 RepID=S9P816_CYSF2|nr:hypothetical protein [Cystobacter fuscus]EPX60570.1 hypothetical protein D187_001724 [Cystobacter fuscus DSM 2262]
MEKPTTNSAQVAQALSGSGGTSGTVHPSTVHGSFQHALAQAQEADKPPATAQGSSTGKPSATASTEKPPATASTEKPPATASTEKPPATAQASSTGKPSTMGKLNQLASSALNGLSHAANFADTAVQGSHLASNLMGSVSHLASSLMGGVNHLTSSLTGGGSTHATHGFEGTHQAPGYGHGGAVEHGATHAASHSHPANLAHSASSAFETGHALLGNASTLAGLLQGGSGALAKAAGRFAPGLNILMAGMDAANAAKTFMSPNATLGQKLNSGITAMGSIAAATNIPVLAQAGATAAAISSLAPLMGSSHGHRPHVGG